MSTCKKPIYISVDGGIAGGKSTLIKCLAPFLNEALGDVVTIKEPVKIWQKMGILKKGYDDPQVWAFPAQCVYFYTRIKEVVKERAAHPDSRVFLAERSPFSDTIFWDLHHKMQLIDPSLHPIYHDMWSVFQKLMPSDMSQPSLIVYLKVTPEECMKRARERGRIDEDALTLDYQKGLIEEHDKRFESGHATMPDGTQVPVYVLETTDDFRCPEIAKKLAQPLIEKIKGLF